MRKLIREVHRRSLWQVLGIYLAGSWVAYEVVQSLTEGLGLPSWFPGLAVVLLIIGLPIVVATAFVQEGLPSREDDAAQPPAGAEAVVPRSAPFAPARHERLLTWRNAVLGGITAFALVGFVHARAGHRDRALAIAGDVERRGGSLKEIALVHAALGDIDTAFEYLERSLEREPSEIATLMSDPSADPLRDDPRFDDLLRRAGYK